MSTYFLLVRHAESTWNAARRWQGHADPPLTDRGLAQARELARRLSDEPLDGLVTSDLERARRTAEILARRLGLVPTLDPRLRELDVGCWQGLTRARIQATAPEALTRFASGDPDAPAGGAESRAALARRVRAVFAELAAAHAGGRVGVVTHRGVIHALLPGRVLDNADFVRVRASELNLPARPPQATRAPR